MYTKLSPPKTDPSSRLAHRIRYDLFFAFCFLVGVHGFNTIKILLILILNYVLAKRLGGTRGLGVVTWAFNVGVLFLNEWYDGYRFGDIHDIAAPLVPPHSPFVLVLPLFIVGCRGVVAFETNEKDAFGGVMHRWQILFNITTLRLISFNFDYHWSCQHPQTLEVPSALVLALT